MESSNKQRFRVSDLGFAFAVHDTQVRQEYAFVAGREKEHASKNVLNGRRIDVFPTRAQAQALADELNAKHAS